MKVEKKMQIEVEHGTVLISWESDAPKSFSVSIDQSGDDRVYSVSRETLIYLGDACSRALAEADAAQSVIKPGTNAARSK